VASQMICGLTRPRGSAPNCSRALKNRYTNMRQREHMFDPVRSIARTRTRFVLVASPRQEVVRRGPWRRHKRAVGVRPSELSYRWTCSTSASEEKVVQYLSEARATEDVLVRVLQTQIAMTPRVLSLGPADPYKTPFDLLRGSGGEEKVRFTIAPERPPRQPCRRPRSGGSPRLRLQPHNVVVGALLDAGNAGSPRLDPLDWVPALDSQSHVEHDAAVCHASDSG
jgi:hypothetical protein